MDNQLRSKKVHQLRLWVVSAFMFSTETLLFAFALLCCLPFVHTGGARTFPTFVQIDSIIDMSGFLPNVRYAKIEQPGSDALAACFCHERRLAAQTDWWGKWELFLVTWRSFDIEVSDIGVSDMGASESAVGWRARDDHGKLLLSRGVGYIEVSGMCLGHWRLGFGCVGECSEMARAMNILSSSEGFRTL